MKRKLFSQFMINYLMIFLLTLLDAAGVCTVILCQQLDFRLAGKSDTLQVQLSRKITARLMPRMLYKVAEVQVVDKEYRVVSSHGLDTIGKDKLTVEEFKHF